MTHIGALATVPHTIFVIAMVWTSLAWIAMWRRGNYWPMFLLYGATSCGLMALWFTGLALSSGENRIIPRAELAVYLRWLEVAAGVVWLAFNIAWTLSGIRIVRKKEAAE
ncbi:MAG: hypothetical protein U0X20_23735 [Caldilineaceae bacterium]